MRVRVGKRIKKNGRWLVTSEPEAELGNYDLVVLVGSGLSADNFLSLPLFINENQKLISAKITNLLRKFADTKIANGCKVSDFMNISGIDLWSVCGATERCVVRNKNLDHLVRRVAIEILTSEYDPSRVDYDLDKRFESLSRNGTFRSGFLRHWFIFLVRAIYKFIGLCFFVWFSKRDFGSLSGKVTVFVDTINIDKSNTCDSRYLPGFSRICEDNGVGPVNWVHGYVPGDSRSRWEFQRVFGALSLKGEDDYLLLDSNLRSSDLLRIFFLYLKLQLKVLAVTRAFEQSGDYLWNEVRDSFIRSLSSGSSIGIIAKHFCYKNVFSRLSDDQNVFYLCEGMPSEAILVALFRKERRLGKIYGLHPGAIKGGDLRLDRYLSGDSPQPDAMLVCSFEGIRLLIAQGFDEKRLLPVEGLKFEYLSNLEYPSSASPALLGGPMSIAYLLEGLEASDTFMLELLNSIEPDIGDLNMKLLIRSHPASSLEINSVLTLPKHLWEVTDSPLSALLTTSDIICASINSSVIIEANYSGKHVIHLFNSKELLRTPFELKGSINLVSKASDLAREIKSSNLSGDLTPYYIIDSTRARWKTVLES